MEVLFKFVTNQPAIKRLSPTTLGPALFIFWTNLSQRFGKVRFKGLKVCWRGTKHEHRERKLDRSC